MKINYLIAFHITITLLFLNTNNSTAQKKPVESAQQLADKLSNPVSNIISVPFQNNTVWGIGPNNGVQNVLNFQPVIPITISKGLTLINRIVTQL